jgi:hypothetical protein
VQRHQLQAQASITDRKGSSERSPQQLESTMAYGGESWRQNHESRAAQE